MAQTPWLFQRPRISLSYKISFAFVGVILWMFTTSIIILLQLKPLLIDQPEFRTFQLSQSLEKAFEAECMAAKKFFSTKNSYDEQTLSLMMVQFKRAADSLDRSVDRKETRQLIQTMLTSHQEYEEIIRFLSDRLRQDANANVLVSLEEASGLRDTVIGRIHAVTDSNIPSLSKSLKLLDQQRERAMDKPTGYIVAAAVLGVAILAAIWFARAVSRPIQSLKAGTEKVGEGIYETVPVTTTDEVSDLTRAFNLMSEKLKKLDEMRMELMSEISHEMRTPLQVIKAGCYSILHTKDGPTITQRQRDAVAMIHQATNRINTFVNSFLDVAKMEAGLMKFNFVDVNLVELMTPLVQESQLIAQTREINLEFIVEDVPSLSLDKERISQVFSNLLSNALKYTPNGGSITVRIVKETACDGVNKNEKGCVRIDVQDTGVGIPESDLAKLFSKFYQAKNIPQVSEKGSGLGLALVKHVAEAHGGKVSVKSQVGVGSTFSVVLPS
jgi:two-component system, NtrC family, sensor histidine kinase GlrK